jgi:hypothetical protein
MEPGQIRETLNSANSALLIIGENYTEEKFLLREAFSFFLKDKGISVLNFPETPKEIKQKWSEFISQEEISQNQNKTSIRIPKKLLNVKELEYEEDEDFFNINFVSGAKKINKNEILIEPKVNEIDIAFCFCQPTAQEIFKDKNWAIKKEVIFIIPNEKTISEKIFELMENTNPYYNFKETSIPQLLFASLILETENFKKNITEGVLSLGHTLLSLGADKNKIDELIKKDLPLSYGQLMGRAMARTRINPAFKSYWTFLTKEDFEKTGIEKPDIKFLSQILRETFKLSPKQPLSVLLWQTTTEVLSLVAKNSDINEEKKFKQFGPYKNFSEAEINIQKNLKEIIL